MSDHRILTVVGTRPEIIKMAPIIKALEKRTSIENIIVHSGQHYEFELSKIFFRELGVRDPDLNLNIGSGTHAEQTSKILLKYEDAIERFEPELVLAEGDTNTVVAASLAAIKVHVPFGHVEAGLRCYDRGMPEEINRTVADQCSELCFAPTERSALNLLYEGIPPHRIRITGNTVVDACLEHIEIARERSRIFEKLDLDAEKPLVLLTVHRPENVDNVENLSSIAKALLKLTECTIIYPVHPRAREMLALNGLDRDLKNAKHIQLTPPLGYFDFLNLLSKSLFVLTDSGGVQEEAITLKVPCLTLRHSTERPETVMVGANIIVGTKTQRIIHFARKILNDPRILKSMIPSRNPLGDGKTGERIARICIESCERGFASEAPTYYEAGSAEYSMIRVSHNLLGKTINTLRSEYPGLLATNIYDQNGTPIFPTPELKLRKGWLIRIFGSLKDIHRLKGMS